MDDLISRQAAINVMLMAIDDDWASDYATDRMNDLPSAQQSRLERAVAGKSPEEIYDFLYWLMFDYARAYTDSRAAIIAWLKGESDG